MTPVSAEGKLLESQASILTISPHYGAYICDGCRRDIPRFVLECKICPNAGYRLVSTQLSAQVQSCHDLISVILPVYGLR